MARTKARTISNDLLPLVVADSASSFYDTKINKNFLAQISNDIRSFHNMVIIKAPS